MKRLALTAAAVLVATGTASAEWKMVEDGDTTMIYTAGAKDGAVILSCDASGKLSLSIAMGDLPVEEAMGRESNRLRKRTGRLMIDGKEAFEGWFDYNPFAQLAETGQRGAASKVYNATIKGQRVSFDLTSKGQVGMTLPPVDDAFRKFATDCRDPYRAYRKDN